MSPIPTVQISEEAVVAVSSVDLSPAGFWIRLGAFVIDAAFLFAADVFLIYSAGVHMSLLTRLATMLISILYFSLTTGAWGQSFGKMLAGIVVVRDEDSGPIGYRRAFARALARIVSGVLLGIGYIVAAFTPRKRALHDYIADTRVVFPEPVPRWRKTAVISTGIVGFGGFVGLVFLSVLLTMRGTKVIQVEPGRAQPSMTEPERILDQIRR